MLINSDVDEECSHISFHKYYIHSLMQQTFRKSVLCARHCLVLGKSLNVSLNSSRRRQKPKLVSKIYNLSGGVKCYEKKNRKGG